MLSAQVLRYHSVMQVSQALNSQKPLILLSSNEPLLHRDWLDQARQMLAQDDVLDIQNLTADAGLDWDELLNEGSLMSMFSERKCRIIHLPSGKPGTKGAKVLQDLSAEPPQDVLYVIVVPALDRQMKNAAWCKAILANGLSVELNTVHPNQLPDWILDRAQGKGINIDRQAAQFLADRTEGNLLAADQELEKLAIRFAGEDSIDYATVEDSVARSSRYNHFLLVDACLSGDAKRAFTILESLRAEGYVSVQIRWAIQAALQQLDQLALSRANGQLNDRLWQQLRIWQGKKRLYQAALQRLSPLQIERLLQSCAKLDRLGKGQQDSAFPEQDWLAMSQLISGFCMSNR